MQQKKNRSTMFHALQLDINEIELKTELLT